MCFDGFQFCFIFFSFTSEFSELFAGGWGNLIFLPFFFGRGSPCDELCHLYHCRDREKINMTGVTADL